MDHQQSGRNDDNRDEPNAEELWEAIEDDYAAEEPDPDDFYPGIVESDGLSTAAPEEDDPSDRPNKA